MTTTTDPRLQGWRERLDARAEEALETLAAVPGVVGLVMGGSFGRGQHWPLSDLDVIVVSSGRPVDDVITEVDWRAYQLSEMWGSSGIYTGVDAGRLTFDESEIREYDDLLARMDDSRWLHVIDKIYGGRPSHDQRGAAQALLDLSARWRFDPAVVDRRITSWLSMAEQWLAHAELLIENDWTGAWIVIRRAATAVAEAATDRWGERAGSLGRYWTHFEARAHRHGRSAFADRLVTAAEARPQPAPAVPEWLADRLALSYQARQLIGEDVTREQNDRDNLLAYAGLYRGRFPKASFPWMAPSSGTDPAAAIHAIRELASTSK